MDTAFVNVCTIEEMWQIVDRVTVDQKVQTFVIFYASPLGKDIIVADN